MGNDTLANAWCGSAFVTESEVEQNWGSQTRWDEISRLTEYRLTSLSAHCILDPAKHAWKKHLFEMALMHCKRALTIRPDWPEALLLMGEVYFKLNLSEHGFECWQQAAHNLRPTPNAFKTNSELFYELLTFKLHLNNSTSVYDALIKITEYLIGMSRFEEALFSARVAFTLSPNDTTTIKRLTAAFLFSGQLRAADLMYQMRVDHERLKSPSSQSKRTYRYLRDFTTHIGHIALLDFYVKAGILGLRSVEEPIVLCGRKPVANLPYLHMWRRFLPNMIHDVKTFNELELIIPAFEDHTHGWQTADGQIKIRHDCSEFIAIQRQWIAEARAPLLELSAEQIEYGCGVLAKMGVPKGAWFVGLHVRNDTWDQVRNSNIESYWPAIDAIHQSGGYVIRMGDRRMVRIPPRNGLIDYAHTTHKSPEMDVFLWGACRFFVGTPSGPASVPPTFGKPCILTNWAPLYAQWCYHNDIYVPKLYFDHTKGSVLTLAELNVNGLGFATSATYLKSLGIELVENSPEEIKQAVLEMMHRLSPYPKLQKATESKYQNLWRIWADDSFRVTNGTISEFFVDRHSYLFD